MTHNTPLIKTIAALVIFTTTVLFTDGLAHSTITKERIKSPYPIFLASKINILKHQCNKPPSPPNSLQFSSVYTNRSNGVSIVDPKAKEKYHAQINDINHYEKTLSHWVEAFIQNKPVTDSFCAIDWLEGWAKQDALLEAPVNFQGGATRKWFLATIASHYVLLKAHVNIPKQTQKIIERWIDALAQEVIKEYSKKENYTSRRNNHVYWAAWAVMVSGSALNNPTYYDWAVKRAKHGLLEIRTNGTLPRELERQSRAFNYHVFSAAPLVMIAETAKQNGDDLYRYNNGALHKLVKLIVSEIRNKQSTFTFLTGTKQDIKSVITPYSLAWIEAYHARFPSSKTQKLISNYSSMKSRRLGGDLTSLFRVTNPE